MAKRPRVSFSSVGSTREPTSMPNQRPALVMAALCSSFLKPDGCSVGSTGGMPLARWWKILPAWPPNDDVRELALGLPADEGEAVLRDAGLPGQGHACSRGCAPIPDALVVWSDEKELLLGADPEKFFTTPHYDGYPMVLVRLESGGPRGAARAADRLLPPEGRYGAGRWLSASFDVVVFGATSVTGRRVCAYLAERGANWAGAARDAGKAEKVLGECDVTAPETITADVTDEASLAAMASRTRVVLNLVGPYTHYGKPVIGACVAGGAHYVDLTGEIPFVRRMIDEFDSAAAEAGVKVVQVSGFEALPADLGVLLAAEAAHERHGEPLDDGRPRAGGRRAAVAAQALRRHVRRDAAEHGRDRRRATTSTTSRTRAC